MAGKKGGAPSTYTPEIADAICDAIADGKSLRDLPGIGLPGWPTIQKWLAKHAEFASQYARAREAQGDMMDDEILNIARAVTNETYQQARIQIDAYKWRAARLAPKRYGDRLTHDGELKQDVTINVSTGVPRG